MPTKGIFHSYLFSKIKFMIKVVINSKFVEIEENESIISLLENQKFIINKGLAVAINNIVIPKNDWNKIKLKNNDNILIIKAAQGG